MHVTCQPIHAKGRLEACLFLSLCLTVFTAKEQFTQKQRGGGGGAVKKKDTERSYGSQGEEGEVSLMEC